MSQFQAASIRVETPGAEESAAKIDKLKQSLEAAGQAAQNANVSPVSTPVATKNLQDLSQAQVSADQGMATLAATASTLDPTIGRYAALMGTAKFATAGAAGSIRGLGKAMKGLLISFANPVFLAAAAIFAGLSFAIDKYRESTAKAEEAARKQAEAMKEQKRAAEALAATKKKLAEATESAQIAEAEFTDAIRAAGGDVSQTADIIATYTQAAKELDGAVKLATASQAALSLVNERQAVTVESVTQRLEKEAGARSLLADVTRQANQAGLEAAQVSEVEAAARERLARQPAEAIARGREVLDDTTTAQRARIEAELRTQEDRRRSAMRTQLESSPTAAEFGIPEAEAGALRAGFVGPETQRLIDAEKFPTRRQIFERREREFLGQPQRQPEGPPVIYIDQRHSMNLSTPPVFGPNAPPAPNTVIGQ